MNNNLLNIIGQITAQYGETLLSEPKRVNSFLADLAQEEPKPQKTALLKCLEHGFAQTLKNVPESERGNCKQKLAQELNNEEGFDLGLCKETLELLEAVLFGGAPSGSPAKPQKKQQNKNLCKKCGNELQEQWQICPFCGTALGNQAGSPVVPPAPASANLQTDSDNKFAKWRQICTFEHDDMVMSVAFSPNGKYIVSASSDGTVKLWDVEDEELVRTFEGHDDMVMSVAFSRDGKYIVSASDDDTVKLWEIKGRQVRTFNDRVYSVAFSPDGKYIVSGSGENTVKLWETGSGRLIHTFEGHDDYVSSVAFSPDGKYIVSGSDDNTINLWNVENEVLVRTFEGHKDIVNSVAFSPDGKYFVSGSGDETIKLWGKKERLIRTFKGHNVLVRSVAFSPDGKYIVSGGGDDRKEKKRYFALKLWDVESGELIRTFEGHNGMVYSVAFSPDGKYIVSGSGDNSLILWGL